MTSTIHRAGSLAHFGIVVSSHPWNAAATAQAGDQAIICWTVAAIMVVAPLPFGL